jgi:hypothetical protein
MRLSNCYVMLGEVKQASDLLSLGVAPTPDKFAQP